MSTQMKSSPMQSAGAVPTYTVGPNTKRFGSGKKVNGKAQTGVPAMTPDVYVAVLSANPVVDFNLDLTYLEDGKERYIRGQIVKAPNGALQLMLYGNVVCAGNALPKTPTDLILLFASFAAEYFMSQGEPVHEIKQVVVSFANGRQFCEGPAKITFGLSGLQPSTGFAGASNYTDVPHVSTGVQKAPAKPSKFAGKSIYSDMEFQGKADKLSDFNGGIPYIGSSFFLEIYFYDEASKLGAWMPVAIQRERDFIRYQAGGAMSVMYFDRPISREYKTVDGIIKGFYEKYEEKAHNHLSRQGTPGTRTYVRGARGKGNGSIFVTKLLPS